MLYYTGRCRVRGHHFSLGSFSGGKQSFKFSVDHSYLCKSYFMFFLYILCNFCQVFCLFCFLKGLVGETTGWQGSAEALTQHVNSSQVSSRTWPHLGTGGVWGGPGWRWPEPGACLQLSSQPVCWSQQSTPGKWS